MLFLHKYDMMSAPVPAATAAAKFKNVQSASVTYESVNLLNYDGKPCNDDMRYNYDDCKQEYIYKVISVGEPKNAFFFSKVSTYMQSHYREVPLWGVSNGARHNWNLFLAYKKIEVFFLNLHVFDTSKRATFIRNIFKVYGGFIGQKILKLWRQKSRPFGPNPAQISIPVP